MLLQKKDIFRGILMKKTLTTLALAALSTCGVALASPAQQQAPSTTGFYNTVSAGMVLPSTLKEESLPVKFNTGYQLGVAAGYQWPQQLWIGHVRTEVAYLRNSASPKDNTFEQAGFSASKAKLNLNAFMLNNYYDMNQLSYANISPFVGFGLGLGEANFASTLSLPETKLLPKGDIKTNVKDDSLRFVYTLTAGVNYQVCSHISTSVAYQFLGTTSKKILGMETNYHSNSINAALTYHF
jgi:opacity protein-like surface antigen